MSDRGPVKITLELDTWLYEELSREARERHVAPEALIAFALSYYLADKDSGRLARRVTPAWLGEPPPA